MKKSLIFVLIIAVIFIMSACSSKPAFQPAVAGTPDTVKEAPSRTSVSSVENSPKIFAVS